MFIGYLGTADAVTLQSRRLNQYGRVVSGRVSAKNFGGPITIVRAANRFLIISFGDFLFFLALISVNGQEVADPRFHGRPYEDWLHLQPGATNTFMVTATATPTTTPTAIPTTTPTATPTATPTPTAVPE